ncbi:response regulator transcription factor [Sinomonas sp. ASV486]|uniref:response regulator transcription factor n=1 Tax=Sinomonas sp. ASV486 TaxID=3051170 RepID=UPI0027DCD9C0|nr:response regulator transcription factor [Sinomonas sp. ASV486]MDQ4489367.1 response regulator transcription factor [Sinomonas sp. ASV486]
MTHNDSVGLDRSIHVFVLDPHEVARYGMRSLLERAGMTVVGESGSAREAEVLIPHLAPDVAVLGEKLTDGNGIEVCRAVRSADPRIQCIILNHAHDEQALFEAVMAGAAGYFAKDISVDRLIDVVRRAAAGEAIFDPDAEARTRSRFTSQHSDDPLMDTLTPQERRVLELVGTGLTNRQIALELGLAEKTAKNYVSSILTKLGMKHRTQAALHVIGQNPSPRPRPPNGSQPAGQ